MPKSPVCDYCRRPYDSRRPKSGLQLMVTTIERDGEILVQRGKHICTGCWEIVKQDNADQSSDEGEDDATL